MESVHSVAVTISRSLPKKLAFIERELEDLSEIDIDTLKEKRVQNGRLL